MQKNNSLLPYQRIIFPLDFPNLEEAKKYITLLKDHVGLFKIGLELFISVGPLAIQTVVEETHAEIFLDMKFHDIPETVSGAQKAAHMHKAKFITVHCDEGSKLLIAVVDSVKNGTKVLAITVLTSLSEEDLKEIGMREELQDPVKLVLHRAELAQRAGCSGVVCSGKEVKAVKERFGKDFIVVVPGIRPSWAHISNDDQARITTPSEAIKNGADYIVIGRPIRDAKDPQEAAKRVAEEIGEALKKI